MAWLPLNPKVRAMHDFDTDKLMDWFDSVQGSDYSFAKEFFAAVDSADEGFPAPFNSEQIPIMGRLIAKYRNSEMLVEIFEGLVKRYEKLALQKGNGVMPQIDSFEELTVLAAT